METSTNDYRTGDYRKVRHRTYLVPSRFTPSVRFTPGWGKKHLLRHNPASVQVNKRKTNTDESIMLSCEVLDVISET